jgi:hypothetical protein
MLYNESKNASDGGKTMTGTAHEPCRITLLTTSKEDNLLRRARGEFRKMPGMRLTVEQAMQWWSLDRPTCSKLFASLAAAGFLQPDEYGRYRKVAAAA